MSGRAQLFVGRLPLDVRERDIEYIFEKYGRLLRCDVKYGSGMAYAFVDYDDRRDAEDAIKYENGREIRGQNVVVEWARGPSYRLSMHSMKSGGGRSRSVYDECYHCRHSGHWARDCPELERDRYYPRRYRSRSRSRSRSRRRRNYSHSRSRSKDRISHHRRRSKSRSQSQERTERYRSKTKSRTPSNSRSRSIERYEDRSKSRSASKSPSPSPENKKPKSCIPSEEKTQDNRVRNGDEEKDESGLNKSRERSCSRSRSISRSRSGSKSPAVKQNGSEQDNDDAESEHRDRRSSSR